MCAIRPGLAAEPLVRMILLAVSAALLFTQLFEKLVQRGGIAMCCFTQRGSSFECSHLSAMDDAYLIGEPFGRVQNLSRVDHRLSIGRGFPCEPFESVYAVWVHAGGERLIQEP